MCVAEGENVCVCRYASQGQIMSVSALQGGNECA